jgi:hypothetical protein
LAKDNYRISAKILLDNKAIRDLIMAPFWRPFHPEEQAGGRAPV